MTQFIGRKSELRTLSTLLELKQASLCVIKGRRRIGKSRLLQEFANSFKQSFTFAGLAPEKGITARDQRIEFMNQLSIQTHLRGISADDWSDIFWHLAQKTQSGQYLIIFDEITWMGDKDPTFLPKLKNAWDLYFSKNPHLILAISGSLSAWIEENILSSTGFLGRVTLEMDLDELPLIDCIDFWNQGSQGVSAFEKLKLLAVTGGIPRYLENIRPHQSAEKNIHQLCFKKNSLLSSEFKKVFTDLYDSKSTLYESIVTYLADGVADQDTLCKKMGIKRSGNISTLLETLRSAGFISRDYTWHIHNGRYSKLSQYRLKDNYTRFYLKYIQPNLININLGNYHDISLQDLPSWNTIMGLQIENLILSNRELIKEKLGIKPSDIVCDNPYFQRKTARHSGCQIDYMIQTKFDTLYICEIKYSRREITTKIIEEMTEKLRRLKIPKHFSYRCVLIHANSVSEAVEDSHFFSHIIDFTEFLNR